MNGFDYVNLGTFDFDSLDRVSTPPFVKPARPGGGFLDQLVNIGLTFGTALGQLGVAKLYQKAGVTAGDVTDLRAVYAPPDPYRELKVAAVVAVVVVVGIVALRAVTK